MSKGKDLDPDNIDPRKSLDKRAPKVLSRVVFYKGDKIIRQGDEGFRAYFIDEGRVEIALHEGPHQVHVTELGPGQLFGEMALITKDTRSATVTALENCSLIVITREEINQKIESVHDKSIRALIKVLIERLKAATNERLHYYKALRELDEEIKNALDRAEAHIDEKRREKFREETGTATNKIAELLGRYKAP